MNLAMGLPSWSNCTSFLSAPSWSYIWALSEDHGRLAGTVVHLASTMGRCNFGVGDEEGDGKECK